jgi:superfamily II DNA or RNA helicase
MTDVHLQYINAVHCKIKCEPSILMELSEHFTYFAENYKFSPKYKNKVWDGKIRLVNRMTGVIYAGLAKRIKSFCDQANYTFSFDEELMYDNVSEKELTDFVETIGLPTDKAVRDYQFDSIIKCLRSKRRTLLSPTSSGKSLMIYIISRWYAKKTLIIVPTLGLVTQMASDFRSYGFEGTIHTSIEGLIKDKNIESDIVITTWQSLDNGKTKVPKQWYSQFDVVFGDEAHGCKATSLIKILSNMESTQYRFGTTGTLDNLELNKVTIEGLFGPQYKSITTRELIDQGYASNLKIKCIVLKYPEEISKDLRGKNYKEEVDFLVGYTKRTDFIKNLALSLEGNKLIFFRFKDHGDLIYKSLEGSNKNIFYIDGVVKASERERIRHAIEDEESAILVASLGTTSTGVSINKLHHMIAASPSKSKIKVLQSIGRMLRQHAEKNEAILYDIVDDLSIKTHKNYTLKHFEERAKIYDSESFDYKIYSVRLK